ncbi:hypothetical protein Droror1_Dr00011750 [Drosera rotundifolia]
MHHNRWRTSKEAYPLRDSHHQGLFHASQSNLEAIYVCGCLYLLVDFEYCWIWNYAHEAFDEMLEGEINGLNGQHAFHFSRLTLALFLSIFFFFSLTTEAQTGKQPLSVRTNT